MVYKELNVLSKKQYILTQLIISALHISSQASFHIIFNKSIPTIKMLHKNALASLLLSLPSALAITEVTAKPLPEACSSYPLYNPDTNTAGPWTIKTVDNGNPAIEGFSDTSVYSVSFNPNTDRKPSLRWGAVSSLLLPNTIVLFYIEYKV